MPQSAERYEEINRETATFSLKKVANLKALIEFDKVWKRGLEFLKKHPKSKRGCGTR